MFGLGVPIPCSLRTLAAVARIAAPIVMQLFKVLYPTGNKQEQSNEVLQVLSRAELYRRLSLSADICRIAH